jgi:predicted acyltransferase
VTAVDLDSADLEWADLDSAPRLSTALRDRPPVASPRIPANPARPRLRSLDVLRGLAIAAMLLVDDPGLPGAHPHQLVHTAWNGLRVADVVFPAFLVAVGVAMPLSRRAAAPRPMLRRVAALVALSLVLHVLKHGDLSPAGVLQHIAGSYAVAWLIQRLRPRWQLVATVVLLAATWAAYTWISTAGIVAGSWAPGTTPGAYLDRLVYGMPQTEGIIAMVLGAVDVLAGAWVGQALLARRSGRARRSVLIASSIAWTATGLALALAIPVNKRLWTPSYAVLTAGLSLAVLCVVHELVDTRWRARWTQPLRELGMNAIAVFVASQLFTILAAPYVAPVVTRPLIPMVGATTASVVFALLVIAASWLMAHLMWRRELFLKV